jgi:hypothetical protein
LNRIKFHAGKVGRWKYNVSSTTETMSAVGPMITACRRSVKEKLCGRSKRKVITDVGRSSTANEARISEIDMYLHVRRIMEGSGTG